MARGVIADPVREAFRRQKIRKARLARRAELGFVNSVETRQRMSEAARQRRATPETRRRISESKKGVTPVNFLAMQAKGWATPKPTGPLNPNWKGDAVGYSALHAWVRKELGIPQCCERCGTETAKRYDWANKSRQYWRDVTDWERLCVSCHRKDGQAHGEYPVARES